MASATDSQEEEGREVEKMMVQAYVRKKERKT